MAPRAILPPLLWAALILFLCLLPGSKLPKWDWFALFDMDKLVHAGMFFIQALLLARVFFARQTPERWVLWSVLLSVTFGVATELLQGMEALGRRTDLNDMIANTIGALVAGWYATRRVKTGKSIVPFLPAH
ncbi:MAG: VanZ family protein [Flavobacteriales bacterium]|jgi:hypothetical protein|nr:VanZ family protein [Flavobacteriales bacterium]